MTTFSHFLSQSVCRAALATCGVLLFNIAFGVTLAAPQLNAAAPKIAMRGDVNQLSPLNQLSQLKIDAWATEQGLPINTVQAIHQSRDGVLWVGTASGLARFDGMRFLTVESAAVPDLTTRAIFGFMEDSQGAVWIGHSRGVSKYQNGRYQLIIDDKVLESRRAWSFVEAADGAVWIATENGLYRWARNAPGTLDASGKITNHYKKADGLPTNKLRALTFDLDGVLWIATGGGGLVSMMPNRLGVFNVLNTANGFPNLEVRHVLSDPAGGVWAATAGGGLVRVTLEIPVATSAVIVKIKTYSVLDGLPTNQLTYLARKKSTNPNVADEIWIGTWGAGVTRMREGKFATLSAAQGLGGDQVWAVHVDREAGVWTGTWNGGLNRLSERVFGVIGKPEGLSNDNARAVIHDKSGVTWVTTAGGGLNRIAAGRITAVTKRDGLATDELSGVLEDRDGAIWVASYTAGVSRIEGLAPSLNLAGKSISNSDKNKFRIKNFGLADGLPGLDSRSIFQDKAGTIWVGGVAGLSRFDGTRFVKLEGLGTEALREGVVVIAEDSRGALWFGTAGKGVARYKKGIDVGNDEWTTFTRKEGLVSNWVLALYEDNNGAMWVGTNGEGMNRIKDGRVSAVRTSDGLWDGTVQVLLNDGGDNLWMTSNRGFSYVPIRELNDFVEGRIAKVTSVRYGPTESLRSTTFASNLQPAGSIDKNGLLWFPSLKGLVIVDPKHLPDAGAPPEVAISEIVVNGISQLATEQVVLPPGALPLSIRYTAATLQHANRVSFRYRIDPISRDWVDAGKNREATFPSLPHGRYQFLVAASIDGKHWQPLQAPIAIFVKPHFYQTIWFVIACAIALVVSMFGLYRLRTFTLRQQRDAMTHLVAEKTEALREANAHLSQLSLTDALTGLANRRQLDATLANEWRRSMRERRSLAVVMIDIDTFKTYNDHLGHPAGDKCLIAVADVIRETTSRAGDFAARYGGEEFIILIPGLTHAAALDYAENLRQTCEARAIPHPASSVANVVTVSVGVAAVVPDEQSSVQALVAEADAALYRAKHEGRNLVR